MTKSHLELVISYAISKGLETKVVAWLNRSCWVHDYSPVVVATTVISRSLFIQNGFTGEAKAEEARKTGFSRLLVHFNPDLQNDFTLQCLDLRKIDEAEADVSRAKEAASIYSICTKIVSRARAQSLCCQARQDSWGTSRMDISGMDPTPQVCTFLAVCG